MEPLALEATNKTPYIELKEGNIVIKGVSDEEDALGFYYPVIQWLENYAAHPAEYTSVELDFRYYNTASAKALFEILKRIARLPAQGKQVEVRWYYASDDEHMLGEIENFSDISHLPIQAVEK